MPRDDRAEAAHGDGQEDRPVRIPGTYVDHRDGSRAEGHEHRVPLPPQQQAGARDEQHAGEDVQIGAFAGLLV
ncbi:hypothetical protein H1V43_04480 [Streptomyces sp. PSKA54]|uniref:Uncharacterized protein n=1 Tax=Streptomyces himalayensis subsp. aureolus TaxID=2758039 RepID=A0A7W2CWY5_9ACTN|nr:hypothetical protein [Streptomyces himalayensis subsp. aureolus]